MLAALAAWPCLAARAQADAPAPEIAAALPMARPIGRGRMRYLGFTVYDARLWAQAGFRGAQFEREPFVLELVYARRLDGRDIAQRSIELMRRLGPIEQTQAAAWRAAMERAFPDVAAGDRLCGLYRPSGLAAFWHNGRPTATIEDADFARRFFGIWLAETTTEPQLRLQLLGHAP
ncbi:chalcone isomerase family protein [Caldimonas sp. KR1-144]|uniref:chalcone isomerase family protein n=1 Tax=Caldimonas sp. KR1-144 TaxID=3400911 RepID=UPI003C0A79B3